MTLWFGVALMTAAAVWAGLWPLARRGSDLGGGSDVAVYRDQLAEIERDRAAGLIAENAAADAQAPPPADAVSATWRRRSVAVAALILLPLGAAALYVALGSPSLPDQPLAARLAGARGNPSIDTLIT